MLAIQNPTHIETAPPEGRNSSEGRVGHSEQIENQFGGIARKKGRKNNGMGAFSKLLAGLVSKKTLIQGQGNLNGLGPPGTAESGSKKGVFPKITEGKGQKNPKEIFSVNRGNKQKETGWRPDSEDQPFLKFGVPPVISAEEKLPKNQSFSFEQASLKTDFSRQVKEPTERKVPFKKGDITDKIIPGAVQNAMLESKNGEKFLNALDRSEKNLTDTKKAGKKRMPVEVHDFRTQTGEEAGAIAERGLKGAEEIRSGSEKEIVVELRPLEGRGERSAETGQKIPQGTGDSFEQLLARELQGDLSTDIVKQAAIVLRDGGEGTIRLSLKPESLGKVKIHLEIAENRILGHIFVDNEEALRAFEQEIHTLEQSFRDSGFEASLNAALDYKDGGQRWEEKMVQPFFSGRFAASYEESGSMEFAGNFITGFGINAINVLV